jgi:glycosyltransferase involved in cell wall biosynthesis
MSGTAVTLAPAPVVTARRLRLAIYYPWLYLKSGGERTIYELVSRSRHDWTIITNRYEEDSTYPEFKQLKIVQLQSVSVKRTFVEVARSAWRIVSQKLPLDGYDAALVFCEGVGDLVVFRNTGTPFACYCFTPLRAAFDEAYQANYLARHPASLTRRVALRAGATLYRFVDRLAWKRYHHVFSISNEVTRRILKGRLCEPEKLSLLYAGIDLANMRPTYEYEPYFLIPGRIMWTKDTALGIRSFIEMKRRRPDLVKFRLVVAGFLDKKSEPYLAELRRIAGTRDDIEFVISPSDTELYRLYQRCYAVMYTPFNEDMGLIPVEAMAFAKPILGINRGGPRETISHGSTGFLIEPLPEEFAKTMIELADNPAKAKAIGRKGVEYARQFDWGAFQETIDSFFDRLAETKAGLSSRRASD